MVLYDEGRLDLDAPVSTLPAGVLWRLERLRHGPPAPHAPLGPSGRPRSLAHCSHARRSARRGPLDEPRVQARASATSTPTSAPTSSASSIEAISGESLDVFLHDKVFEPLGMNDTFFRPGRLAHVSHRANRNRAAARLPAAGRGARRERVRVRRRRRPRGTVQHRGRPVDLRADDAERWHVQRRPHRSATPTVALFTHRAAGTRALGWDTADGDGGSGKFLDSTRLRPHGLHRHVDLDRPGAPDVRAAPDESRSRRPGRRPAKVISDVRADLADAAVASVVDNPDNVIAMPRTFRADKAAGWNRPVRTARKSRSHSSHGGKAQASKKPGSKSTAKKSTSSAGKASAKPSASKSSSKAKSGSSRTASSSKSASSKHKRSA